MDFALIPIIVVAVVRFAIVAVHEYGGVSSPVVLSKLGRCGIVGVENLAAHTTPVQVPHDDEVGQRLKLQATPRCRRQHLKGQAYCDNATKTGCVASSSCS